MLCSFRDRQGADVAPLVRCARDWLAAGELQCVGTSAPLAGAGTFVERKAAVAKMTFQVFGTTVKPEHVTGETLVRTLELTYTAWDLEPFAKNCGYNGPPFRRNEERRFLLRCEVGATYFHLYGIERDDVDYIMEMFPIVKCRDEQKYSDYRTKRVILESYNEPQRESREMFMYAGQ